MWTRRAFLELPVATAIAGCLGDNLHERFFWGVASGDPTPSSIVLWTRCEPAARVTWTIATDAELRDVIASGEVEPDAANDNCIKVLVESLEPGRTYHYQFSADGRDSPRGRTRTAPRDAAQLRFAVASCASLAHGYFHAYRHIAERDDIDAVIFLGDYIYEFASERYGKLRPYEPPHELVTLDDYRTRYRQYRSDPDLQALHAAHPMIAIWDDHEIANDAFATGAANHDPSKQGDYTARLEAALRAYMENIPLAGFDRRTCARAIDYGSLAELVLLDTRTERDAPVFIREDPAYLAETRRMIGETQEAFVLERLHASQARWRVVCQTTMFAHRLHDDELAAAQWDGYPLQRERLLTAFGERLGVIVLGGDLHSAWAIDLAEPVFYDPVTGANTLAVELIVPGITSPNVPPGQAVGQYAAIATRSPHVRYVDLSRQGYVLVELDETGVQATFYHVDDVRDPEAGRVKASRVLASAHAAPHWVER